MTNLPNLDFLYFNPEITEENYSDKREIYYDKVGWDERHFENYAETCSFEELIYLMIYIYKDRYPREKFHSTISVDSQCQNLLSYNNKNGRAISENKYIFSDFFRKDVIGMNVQYHNEEYSDEEIIEKYWMGEYHIQNLFLEFNQEVSINIIDKALEGKEYTKTKKNNVLFYEVKDSSIASLEVTKNSIKLNINEDKVILYVSIY